MEKHNLFTNIPEQLPEELFETLLQTKGTRIERIVSQGHATAADEWYDQLTDEWVILLTGSATLSFDQGETHQLKAGDYIFIPAHCRHRVEATTPHEKSVWLAVHLETPTTR